MNCTAALTYYLNCLDENNYDYFWDEEILQECKIVRIELDCVNSAFVATTCPDEQKAIDALARLWPVYEANCGSLGNATTSVVAGYLTVIIMTCVSLLY